MIVGTGRPVYRTSDDLMVDPVYERALDTMLRHAKYRDLSTTVGKLLRRVSSGKYSPGSLPDRSEGITPTSGRALRSHEGAEQCDTDTMSGHGRPAPPRERRQISLAPRRA